MCLTQNRRTRDGSVYTVHFTNWTIVEFGGETDCFNYFISQFMIMKFKNRLSEFVHAVSDILASTFWLVFTNY